MEHVSFHKMEGHLNFDIEFTRELKEVYTVVMFSHYNNRFNLNVPIWEVTRYG